MIFFWCTTFISLFFDTYVTTFQRQFKSIYMHFSSKMILYATIQRLSYKNLLFTQSTEFYYGGVFYVHNYLYYFYLLSPQIPKQFFFECGWNIANFNTLLVTVTL